MLRFMACLLVCFAAIAGGCTSTYDRMARAEQFTEFARLDASAKAIGNKTTRVPVTLANGTKAAIAVHESGSGDHDRLYILIHGAAGSAKSWRFVRGGLTDGDVIAIDLLGCGESDAPPVAKLGDEGYTPTALARSALQALQTRLALRKTPAKITLVGHSLGGATILRMFGDEKLRSTYHDVLDHVDSIVLLAPPDVTIAEPSGAVRTLMTVGDTEVVLAALFGMTREYAARAELDGVCDAGCALRENADLDAALLNDTPRRHAMQAMIRNAVPEKHGMLDWEQAEMWQSRYKAVNVPCLIVWGSRDPVLPVAIAFKMQAQIPGAKLRIIHPGKHTLMTEQPQLCVDLIRDFAVGKISAEPIADVIAAPLLRAADSKQ